MIFRHTRTALACALISVTFVAPARPQTGSLSRPHVEALTSEAFDGRFTGSKGEQLAAGYIVQQLQRIGAKPLPGATDFRMPFDFTAGSKDGGSAVTVEIDGRPAASFATTADVQALAFSDNAEAKAPVVFAGYGIVVPDSQGLSYDSYAGIDVKDKIVLVLRYFPEDADQKTRAVLARYADLRYKAQAARQRGAKALLVVTGPKSPNAGETVPMTFDTANAGSGIVAASISAKVANALFAAITGRTLADAQAMFDSGDARVNGFSVPGASVTIKTAVERQRQTGTNLVAYLPATTPIAGVAKPWLAVGAHYDHLGRGTQGNSLARKEEIGKMHPGADDNASGTAAVLALAEQVAKQPRHRNVLLLFWSGEEIGLVGSAAFAAKPPLPLDTLEAYVNFDMVGRAQDNKLTIQALGSSAIWSKVVEQANIAAGFDLQLQDDPYQPTDVATFNGAGVPCITFFTGTHPDYHRPADTADKINYEDLDRIATMGAAIVRRVGDMTEAPAFVKVEAKTQTGGRAGVRVFTGTIPDYAADTKGLLLGGVIGGGPAEQAGLQKGDVVVEIAGQTIANIYDYTFALELLKIGQPAKVVYTRNGERKETTLTPAARK